MSRSFSSSLALNEIESLVLIFFLNWARFSEALDTFSFLKSSFICWISRSKSSKYFSFSFIDLITPTDLMLMQSSASRLLSDDFIRL